MENERMKFPEVTASDMVWGHYPQDWFDETLKQGLQLGPQLRKYEDKVTKLFFEGGRVEYNKKLDPEYIKSGMAILKTVLGSYAPKHEHKTTVCAMILRALEEKEK